MTRLRISHLVLVVALVGASLGAIGAPQPAAAVPLANVRGVVACPGGLNLRLKPSWSGSIVKFLPDGTALTMLQTSGDWFKVSALKRTGWVNSWYTRLTGTLSVAISRGNPNRKMIALTFDAGADLGYTQTIIETLEREGVHATFGLTGSWISKYPEYAAWIAADGFQIVNHTLNHLSYTGLSTYSDPISPAKRIAQIEAEEAKIRAIGGWSKPYWRPPFGDIDSGVLRDAGAAGYAYTVMWTVDSLGWNGLPAADISWRVRSNACNGAIILMHVGAASQDAIALPGIIKSLRAQGYTFGTVSEVIG